MRMNIQEFDYNLPKTLIAQYPEKDRQSSRMLVLNRKEGTVSHHFFKDVVRFLEGGDVLVLNDSKVIPARLKGRKDTGGAVDILLVERINQNRWYCLANGIKASTEETRVHVGHIPARLTKGDTYRVIDFDYSGDVYDIIDEHGKMPLPPYIKRTDENGAIDFDRYQTVYAEKSGSIAAPTAGFHFTEELLASVKGMGVQVVTITLHIGVGTFSLIKAQQVQDHRMHGEYYHITPETKSLLRDAKNMGRRIIACGTSAVRTLETIFGGDGSAPLSGKTELYIYPGHDFKMVDGMITNFHLSRSTPLLLVSAFAGKDMIKMSYLEAIEKGYRFYSYGDAMLIL